MKGSKSVKSKPTIAKSSAVPINEHHSVSVSKISNGYIIRESHDGPNGYTSKETYSRTKPKVTMIKSGGK